MGVLYAKVGGAWTPILNSAGSGDPAWPNGYPTYDPRYVNVSGDAMQGALTIDRTSQAGSECLRVAANVSAAQYPSITLHDSGAMGRLGYIQGIGPPGANPGLRIWADNVNPIMFHAGGLEQFRIRSNASGEIVSPIGTPDNYIGFRDGTATGTRQGIVGMSGGWFKIIAENFPMMLQANSGNNIRVQTMGPQAIDFYTDSAFQARIDSVGNFLFQKTANDITTAGAQIVSTGMSIGVTSNLPNTPNIALNKIGAGIAAGHDYINFRNTNTNIGSITRNASTAAVLYNTTSDYRLKEDRGLIDGARERIKVLRPRRVIWKEDETRQEQDAFFAHEVAEAVPEAVTGEKDGEAMQMLDASKLIPLMVAAIQELTTEVEQLRAEVAQLKGAA